MCAKITMEVNKNAASGGAPELTPWKVDRNSYLFGVSYAPYAKCMDPSVDEWDQDMKTFHELGFNVIRVFAPWDRIERNEGEYDFSLQDRIFDLGGKYDIKIILNMGGMFWNYCGIHPPQWLLEKHDCCLPMDTPEHRPKYFGPDNFICIDDPLLRSKAEAFMKETVRRYRSRKELAGWMIWNEPQTRKFCYCRATLDLFRQWLQQKYRGNLDELNRMWSEEHPVRFHSWDKVEPPHGNAFSYGHAPWLDWYRFTEYRIYSAMENIKNLVRKEDPDGMPTTANLTWNYSCCGEVVNLGRLGRILDMGGVSYYTQSEDVDFDCYTPDYQALRLSQARGLSKVPGAFYILEADVGSVYSAMPSRKKRIKDFWQTVAHGSKAFVGWNGRCRMSGFQTGDFNLLGWDGGLTDRARYFGELAQYLQKHAELINSVTPDRQAALLIANDPLKAAWAVYSQRGFWSDPGTYGEMASYKQPFALVTDCIVGAFKMVWDMNIPADIISEATLDRLMNYKVLLLPLMINMNDEIAGAIEKYVFNGGTVIAETPFAMRDCVNILQKRAPGFGLAKVFGCSTNDYLGRRAAQKMSFTDGKTALVKDTMTWFRLEGGEAVAAYEDGSAAIVVNSYGKGKTVLLGTQVFRQYYDAPKTDMAGFLRNAILSAGAQPTAELEIDGITAIGSRVEVSKLIGDKNELFVLINHNNKDVKCRIKFNSKKNEFKNIENGKIIMSSDEVMLSPYEVMILSGEH